MKKSKKTLSAALIASLILMPMPVFAADDEDDYIHTLSFSKIADVMKERSPLILIAEDKIENSYSELNDMRDGLEAGIADLQAQLGIYTQKLDAATIANDQALIDLYGTIVNNLSISLISSQAQLANLEDQKDNMWKSWLQVDQGRDQAVWGAQQIFLSYFNLSQTKNNLENNLGLLQKKLAAQQLKETLGLSTHIDTITIESQLKELRLSLDGLSKALEALIGQMNVMLGQDFDTELSFSEPSILTQSKLKAMDYEDDLEEALDQNYDVMLKEDDDERDNAELSLTLAFHQVFQSVLDKKAALDLEYTKLDQEKIKYDQNTLMHSLGLISSFDYEGLRSLYETQVNKVKSVEQDLLKAYTAYEWMKDGLTVSTSSGSQGAGASSTTSGASSSGMGF